MTPATQTAGPQPPWLRTLTGFSILAALLFCVARAWALRNIVPTCDAGVYVRGALDLRARGVFASFTGDSLRSYGYPAFLALVGGPNLGGALSRFILTISQFCCYLAATFSLQFGLRQAGLHREARFIVLLNCLNIPALALIPEFLTDSLSLSICLMAASLLVSLPKASGNPRPALLHVLGLFLGLTIGLAVAVRPGNIWLGACVVLVSLGHAWYRGAKKSFAWALLMVCFSVGAAIPLSIQVRNNYVHHQRATPLVTYDLAHLQFEGGKRLIKYTTKVAEGQLLPGNYPNPLYKSEDDPDSSRWYLWYIRHPAAGLGTLLLKVFNVLDVDLLFPYGEARNPWYRWPICLFNQLLLCFGVIGTLWSARKEAPIPIRFAAFVVVVYFICFMGVHSVAAVESRYGLPMLGVALTFVPSGITFLRREAVAGQLRCMYCLSFYLAGALMLSNWVHRQLA